MSLIRWNSDVELNTIQRQMNSLFDSFFSTPRWSNIDQQFTACEPLVDIKEDDGAYYIQAELPGVNRDALKITMNNNQLTIRGEKRQNIEQKESNFHRIERNFGSFERTFTLPGTVRSDKIEATYHDGVLMIELPKSEEAKPKEIQVKVK